MTAPEAEEGQEKISWKNHSLKRAIKQLIFFAEVFPKKYRFHFYNKQSINKVYGSEAIHKPSLETNLSLVTSLDGS